MKSQDINESDMTEFIKDYITSDKRKYILLSTKYANLQTFFSVPRLMQDDTGNQFFVIFDDFATACDYTRKKGIEPINGFFPVAALPKSAKKLASYIAGAFVQGATSMALVETGKISGAMVDIVYLLSMITDSTVEPREDLELLVEDSWLKGRLHNYIEYNRA